ncbi:glycosyltransferase family 2 protein [Shimia aestuarii]|uniref:glycosyltransferase family 2 protein n=1 Tax=Shimia aestuarii TaxID=254406 RepID=UPI001FB461DC|nr:glycosyltransferase family 2 protein [Shimia aestuarii]
MRVLSVTSMRNEGPYLLEWLAHHRAAGVTDFLVFSNDCEDGTAEMLDLLDAAGVLSHVPQERQGKKSVQWQALRAAWKHPLRKAADWVLVSDVDEFLNIRGGDHTLDGLIDGLAPEVDGVVIPWRLYGNNSVVEVLDAPVTEQFTRAIEPGVRYPAAAGFFKTLFRTKGPFNQLGVHRPQQKAPERAGLPVFVDGSGMRLPDSLAATPSRLSLFGFDAGQSLVEMNHYSIRSAAGFLVKRARGLPNRSHKPVDLAYWVERNFNTVEDRSIAAMRPATEAALAELREIDGIAAAHERAVAWHQARFAELVRQPEEQALLVDILTAGSSQTLPRELQLRLVQWYQDANN